MELRRGGGQSQGHAAQLSAAPLCCEASSLAGVSSGSSLPVPCPGLATRPSAPASVGSGPSSTTGADKEGSVAGDLTPRRAPCPPAGPWKVCAHVCAEHVKRPCRAVWGVLPVVSCRVAGQPCFFGVQVGVLCSGASASVLPQHLPWCCSWGWLPALTGLVSGGRFHGGSQRLGGGSAGAVRRLPCVGSWVQVPAPRGSAMDSGVACWSLSVSVISLLYLQIYKMKRKS